MLSYLNLSELYYDVGQLERDGDYTADGVALARQLKLTNYELACFVGRAQALARQGALTAAANLLAEIKLLADREEEWNIRGTYDRAQGLFLVLRPGSAGGGVGGVSASRRLLCSGGK
ncbi:MAG: hypothetical protein HND44_01515 [Chloroflexi bacterium]|nr:hypothetical protein [Ardenticatenaceae bacterium]MBL1127177.1 hypothetical protein [Chloroflexota bacterium]NOG33238.1 hypothetical protein [Chloroflexota bacterium]